jgi:hypothetical protein
MKDKFQGKRICCALPWTVQTAMLMLFVLSTLLLLLFNIINREDSPASIRLSVFLNKTRRHPSRNFRSVNYNFT